MATVHDLLTVQRAVVQILATGASHPTVAEVTDRAEARELVAFLVDRGQVAGADMSAVASHLSLDSAAGREIADALESAANSNYYGFDTDSPLGLVTVLWWTIDLMPAEARATHIGW